MTPMMKGAPVIVGMACHYRGGVGPAAYWDLLTRNASLQQEPYERVTPDGEALDEIETSLAATLVHEALADAADRLADRDHSQTALYVARSRLRMDGRIGQLIAPVIARQLDLRGPILDVDADCASALVAIAHACAALRAGLCRTAIVVAVRSASTAREIRALARSGATSSNGRGRPFDSLADGYVPGAGGGAIVLCTSASAGYGSIVGAAAGHVGNRSAGFAMSFEPFADIVRRLCADIAPNRIGYVEANAVGSRIGDELEVLALAEGLLRNDPTLIGAVKGLIGHLQAASGMAALQKVALMAYHGTIPACERPQATVPALTGKSAKLTLAAESTPWPVDGPTALTVAVGQCGTLSLVALARTAPTLAPTDRESSPRASAVSTTARDLAAAPSVRAMTMAVLVDVLGTTTPRTLEKLETGSFFELGLDSIKAATAARKLSDELGIPISPVLFFKRDRLATLVADLVAAKANGTSNAGSPTRDLETLILSEPERHADSSDNGRSGRVHGYDGSRRK
jgi:acyl transferase domain-containing protein/acyl carrier protein